MWVPTYWYESTPIQDCEPVFLMLKKIVVGGFCPALGFHLISWCSCVLLMCDDMFCFIAPVYYLYD